MRIFSVLLAGMLASALIVLSQGLPAHAHNGSSACNPNLPWDRPEGLLIVQEYDTAQYLIRDCGKWPIANWNDLVSHHFDSSAVTVSAQEFADLGTGPTLRAREGTLYREQGDTAVWIIDETGPGMYRKRFITGQAWSAFFSSCNYTDSHISQVAAGFMNVYYPARGPDVTNTTYRPDGQIIIDSDGPYALEGGEVNGLPNKRRFASLNAFYTYNFPYPTCYATGYPGVTPDLRAREGTRVKSSSSTAQYLIEKVGNNYYKRFVFANSLTFYGISGTLRTWSSAEVNGYANLDHVHPVKVLLPDRFERTPSASAPLLFDRSYQCSGCDATWGGPTASAVNQWNARSTTIELSERSYSGNNEVHMIVRHDPLVLAGGWVELYAGGVYCGDDLDCSGAYYNQANVFVNNAQVQPTNEARNAITSHEIGHIASLDHDGLNPDANGDGLPDGDGRCGNQPSGVYRVPQTIMDYDCLHPFTPGFVSPVAWDDCGVNHKYSSGFGFAGC